jgi:diguanylate cyclase (GGDEF)-like protein
MTEDGLRPADRQFATPVPSAPTAVEAREAELTSLGLLATSEHGRLERFTELARAIFGVPTAFVSLLGEESQVLKGACGTDIEETPREHSFCQFLVDADVGEILVIEDAAQDPRTCCSPFVTGPPHLRFYAGAVLRDAAGTRIGSLCIVDQTPRTLGAQDTAILLRLRDVVQQDLQMFDELDQARERARTEAYYDSLTGLPGQALAEHRLQSEIDAARAEGKRTGVVFANVLRLNSLNMARGRAAGDEVIRTVAERLTNAAPEGSFVGRRDNGAFVIVLPDLADDQALDAIKQQMRGALAEPFEVAGERLFMDTSLGGAVYPLDGRDVTELVETARSMMKPGQRDTGPSAGAPGASERDLARDFEVEKRLREAIEQDRLHLHYQPQIELSSCRIVGLEALLRWHDTVLGAVSPAEFVPAAERAGLISQVALLVAERAAAQAAAWRTAGHRGITVAVNLTADDLQRPGMAEDLREAVRRGGAPPQQIQFEVTEGTVMRDPDTAVRTMRTLSGYGFRFAIDDFGVGYSSFSHLQQLPVDELKIDKSFVQRMTESESDASLVHAMVSLGRSLGLRVIAEGAETEEQVTFLRAYNCATVQGFYFGRPEDGSTVSALLARWGTC